MRKGVDQLREERALHASVLRAHEEHRIAHHQGADQHDVTEERTATLRRKLEILDRAIADAEPGRATEEGGEAGHDHKAFRMRRLTSFDEMNDVSASRESA